MNIQELMADQTKAFNMTYRVAAATGRLSLARELTDIINKEADPVDAMRNICLYLMKEIDLEEKNHD